jgi:hypothetical protein
LRDHVVFRKPRTLDLGKTITMKTPEDWLGYVSDKEKQHMTFLPLADGAQRERDDGWCTYAQHIGDSPEVEIMCGGRNHKLPTAAAVWRQGNMLHFGFQESPAQLNANGRKLLENCIVYIAGFLADRPLAHTPSPFVEADYPKPKRYARSMLMRDGAKGPAIAETYFVEAWRVKLARLDLASFRRWFRQHEHQLCSGEGGKLTVDEDAVALGVPLGGSAFFTGVRKALTDDAKRPRALALLARRVTDGPGAKGSVEAWQQFLAANERFLFYVEEGGYQWHLDPLAKARGVPCAELRGPARAGPAKK